MHKPSSFLCLDVGAAHLKAAEFVADRPGRLRLVRYAVKPLGSSGSPEAARDSAVLRAMRDLVAEAGFASRQCSVGVPAFQVFTKYLELPEVDAARLAQLMRFEAPLHLPFPVGEMVWDYRVLGRHSPEKVDVMLVGLRAEPVEQLCRAAESAHLRVQVIDASPAALTNAFRYNYSDLGGVTLLLDIGARTSQVFLFEGDRVFSRSLQLGSATITREFASAAGLSYSEAERLKIAEGFVGLGGAFVEPDQARAATLAKISRQVMARLDTQVAQTVHYYRSQYGGSGPQRLLLAGGGSLLPYTARFFSEKLELEAEAFNPFRRLEVDASLDLEELARVAPSLGEVVGLALRTALRCPIELNLVPGCLIKQQQLARKVPFLAAAVATLVLAGFGLGGVFGRLAAEKRAIVESRQPLLSRLTHRTRQMQLVLAQRDQAWRVADQLRAWNSDRQRWIDLLTDLRRALVAAEAETRRPESGSGLWIERLIPELPPEPEAATEKVVTPRWIDPRILKRYYPHLFPGGASDEPAATGTDAATLAGLGVGSATPPATSRIDAIRLVCRAVSWSRVRPGADHELAYAFLKQLQASPHAKAGPEGARLEGSLSRDERTGTFSFEARLLLDRPIEM